MTTLTLILLVGAVLCIPLTVFVAILFLTHQGTEQ